MELCRTTRTLTILAGALLLSASAMAATPAKKVTKTNKTAKNSLATHKVKKSKSTKNAATPKKTAATTDKLSTSSAAPSFTGNVGGVETSSPVAGSSGSTAQAATARWTDNLGVAFSSVWSGPNLDNLADFSGASSLNILGLSYRFQNNWSMGVTGTMGYNPNSTSNQTALFDPFLSMSRGRIINQNGYTLGASLRTYFPASDGSQAAHKITRLRLIISQTYNVPDTRWSLGLTAFAQGHFYTAERAANATRLDYLMEPTVSYQILPNLSAALTYDMTAGNSYNHLLVDFENASTLLMPSLSWDAARWLTLEPSLGIATGGPINAKTTTTNLTAVVHIP